MGQRRAEVLQAAIELLDEAGLDALTMRLLAERLGVRASALYRHYPSKQALLDAMVEHLSTPPPGMPPFDGAWDEQLRAIGTGVRDIMLAHRDGARLMSTFHNPGPAAVASYHALIAALVTAGAPQETAAAAVDTVLAYVNGFTAEEQARKADQPRPDRDRVFHAGLDLIITGVRASLS